MEPEKARGTAFHEEKRSMANRVDEILSWYGSDNPGVLSNLRWMLDTGRLVTCHLFDPEVPT